MSRQIEELNIELEALKEEQGNAIESLKYYKDKCKNLEIALLSISYNFMKIDNLEDVKNNNEVRQMILDFKSGGVENLTDL